MTALRTAKFQQEVLAYKRLTKQQKKVLKLIAENYTPEQIVPKMNMCVSTVKNHRTRIQRRLNLWGLPGLTLFAVRVGIVKV